MTKKHKHKPSCVEDCEECQKLYDSYAFAIG
jgi:hypothetical protein